MDPRPTLAPLPGTNVALMNGILHEIVRNDWVDHGYVRGAHRWLRRAGQAGGGPTAQNTRECGADGDLPAFRNWSNDAHIADLARISNIDQMQIPHYSSPTHVMQMMRFAEEGSIRFLWVSATNPAVSLPELSRIRSIPSQERLFLVVQDIFLTETAALADVVLPAAT